MTAGIHRGVQFEEDRRGFEANRFPLEYLPASVVHTISGFSREWRRNLQEIRLKCGCVPVYRIASGFVCPKGETISAERIEATVRRICESSEYAQRERFREGYLSLPGGHRVGLLGSAVLDGGCVCGMRDVYGLVIRIAGTGFGIDSKTVSAFFDGDRVRSGMIIGPPGSGKTTALRALARLISARFPVAVIDEREELFPRGFPLPWGCDVLRGYPKGIGGIRAIRNLSPQVLIFDEIGDENDVSAAKSAVRCGVSVIATAHAESEKDLLFRPGLRDFFTASGAEIAVVLEGAYPNRSRRIVTRGEVSMYDGSEGGFGSFGVGAVSSAYGGGTVSA